MAVKSRLLRSLIPWFVSRGLTGRASDLKRIIRVARRIPTTVAARRFFDGLEYSLEHHEAMGELFLRIGRQLSPRGRSRISTNLIYHQFIAGYPIRRKHIEEGNWVPGFFVMSPTMRCNLTCRGCYSAIYPRQEELSFEEMDRILTEAEDLGIYFIVISGGEPYLLSDRLLPLFRKHRKQYFLTYTNATLLD
ncbi:MAG TPA: radical SAM protein, partial [Spirochaetia bacterium]|nr:radical SAM protein [Spirochaetia bacterium]